MSSAWNASEIAISNCEVQPSAEIKRVHCEMLVKLRFLILYKDLAQEVLIQDPDAEILTKRS